MPRLEVSTTSANSIWRSPDGQREIFEVVLDYNGKAVRAKTYSKEISTAGWSGTVETYEKPNRGGGNDTFVKQPQKEGFQGGRPGGGRGGMADPFAMYLSYAKDLAISSITVDKEGTKFDGELFTELLEAAAAGGAQLFAQKGGDSPPKQEATRPPDVVHDAPPELSMEDLNAALGDGIEKLNTEGDDPWNNQTS